MKIIIATAAARVPIISKREFDKLSKSKQAAYVKAYPDTTHVATSKKVDKPKMNKNQPRAQFVGIDKKETFQLEFFTGKDGKQHATLDHNIDLGDVEFSGDTDMDITAKTTKAAIEKHLKYVLKAVENDMREEARSQARRQEDEFYDNDDEEDEDSDFDIDDAAEKNYAKIASSKQYKQLKAFVGDAPKNADTILKAYKAATK